MAGRNDRDVVRRGFWRRNRTIIGHWTLFLAVYGFLLVVFFHWPGTAIDRWLVSGTAKTTALCLAALGLSGRTAEGVVTSSIYSVRIISECTALFPAMIFVAAVIAYPTRWRHRLAGIVTGIPALLAINQVRLVSLFFIGNWIPSQFERIHLVVWPSILVFITIVLWLVWATRIERAHAA